MKKCMEEENIEITEEFSEFIRNNIYLPVKAAKPSLKGIQLFYDQECEHANNDHIVILYHYPKTLYRFFLNTRKAYNALIASQTPDDPVAKKVYDDFINEFNTVHIPLIISPA